MNDIMSGEFQFPTRRSRRTTLRAIQSADYAWLFDLSMQPENCIRWRHRGTTPNIESFVRLLWQDALAVFVVELNSSRRPLGVVTAYKHDYRNGTVYCAAMLSSGDDGRGAPIEAFALFSHYLFTVFPIRKIYLEMVAYNYEAISSGEGKMFSVEGILKEQDYYNGRYWDNYILTLDRDPALAFAGQILDANLMATPL